jgi:hypothetical protein
MGPGMSGESDKPRVDPNSTIQLDAIEGLEGIELNDMARKGSANVGSRPTPPPLPPEASSPPPALGAVPASASTRSVGKNVAYAAMLVAVVGLAMAAGLSVGSRARAKFGAAHAAALPRPASSKMVAAPGSASARELTLPPIEIKGP